MASLLNIGVNGLKAQQAALNVTGQNVTNASTPGYSRQRADLVAQSGGVSVGTFSGAGARVDKITRIADQFIGNQIRIDQALSSELNTFSTRIGQLEGSLFDDGFGLDSALQDFFDALNNASSNPSDSTARQFVLSRGESLAQRFQGVAERVNQQAIDIVASLDAAAKQVNDLARLIADSNVRIANVQGDQASGSINQLLDQRDGLLKELASLTSVTTSEQADGQVSVFIGKGQTLVLGAQAAQLDISSQGAVMLAPVGNSVSQNITSAISGGEMGGLLSYRSQVLEPAQNEIGYMAASIVVAFNQQHALGIDANGEFGLNFFSDINNPNLVGQRIVAFDNGNGSLATATVNVFIDDPLSFDPSDYEFRVAENGSFTIERSIDGEMVFQGASLTTPQTVEFDGLRIEFAAGDFQPGQTIRIRPYASIGTEMSVALSDVSSLALSSPVLIEAGVANQGSAVMTVGAITDSMSGMFGDDQSLVPPLLVRFVNDVQYEVLDNSNPGNPQPLNPDIGLQTYIPGILNSVLPYEQGSTVTHSSGPAVAALAAASLVSDLSPSPNNYPSGSVQITTLDPITGEVLSQPTVAIAAGSSARAIAQQISSLAGVSASARTSLEISNLVDYDSGVPVELAVNGQLITGFSSLDELADAINANSTLQSQSIVALSDGQTLTLISQQGDDLNLHFQGDPNESIEVTSSSG
ncbi:MAG: flagellar hook-associated protein FlgK, partial [Gammaproteobacteria bacterium]|nr:flagellar hook-associated protein FlgK [Gammaproteobacteria bacterium]